MNGPETPASVGQQLKDRREELDLTQEAAAQLIGITGRTVSAAETGETMISRGKRPAWERVLRLRSGTITRAYNAGSAIETVNADQAQADPSLPDPADPREVALWEMPISEDDRRELIRLYRLGLEREREQGGEGRRLA